MPDTALFESRDDTTMYPVGQIILARNVFLQTDDSTFREPDVRVHTQLSMKTDFTGSEPPGAFEDRPAPLPHPAALRPLGSGPHEPPAIGVRNRPSQGGPVN